MTGKTCPKCGERKAASEFHANRTKADGLQCWCRDCLSNAMRQRRYGLSADQYNELLRTQGGRCAVCRSTDPGKHGWHIDHDHSCCPAVRSGKVSCGRCVRGLLCRRCNHALGHFGDSVELMADAIAYLLEWESVQVDRTANVN